MKGVPSLDFSSFDRLSVLMINQAALTLALRLLGQRSPTETEELWGQPSAIFNAKHKGSP